MLRAETTQHLYAEARRKAAMVTERCKESSRITYLEALSYLFAYYQVASRDGSLKGAADFDQTIKSQYSKVLRTARKCLELVESSAAMRDDGTGARIAPPPPVYRVDLPDPPPAGASGFVAPPADFSVTPKVVWLQPGATQRFEVTFNPALPPPSWSATGGTLTAGGQFTAGSTSGLYRLIAVRGNAVDTAFIAVAGGEAQTDPQGRTIPQLVAIIDQFPQERAMYRGEIQRIEQQRDALAAEVARLRNLQPAPPPPPPSPPRPANMSGEWRIQVKANGLFWHEDGNGDRKISTRYQPNDDFTRFILELQPDGSYRIRVKATGRYLHAPGHADWTLSTLAQVDDDYTRFFLEPEPDGRTFRLRQKATGRYLGQGQDMLLTNGDTLTNNDFIRFLLHR